LTSSLQAILQISTFEKSGGAALNAWYLHQEYRKRGILSWMAVGHKETSDPSVFNIPNEMYRRVWARGALRISNLISKFDRNFPRAPHPSQGFALLAEPSRQINIMMGREDFCYPGSHKILALTPQRPSIVNCNNLHGWYFDLRVLPWLSGEVPVVLTLHDEWLLTGHCACTLDCERWRIGCGQCPYLNIYPAIRRDATAYNWSRKQRLYAASKLYVVTPSQWLMNRVGQSMLAPSIIKERVIPNAVDISVFKTGDKQAARAALGLPQEIPTLLFVAHGAQQNPFKDFNTVKGAMERLATLQQDKPVLLVCLGGEAMEKRFGNTRILCLGYVKDRHQISLFYQAADVFLHAAKAEVWGKTVTEALACGIPVVATAVGGISEQIEDGVTGFLTPKADAGAMAARIAQLIGDSQLRERMGLQAAEVARKRFSLDRQVDEYLEWFDDIVRKWQPPR
jgi:glycosyltransferase involved in cell wall biosynthesis